MDIKEKYISEMSKGLSGKTRLWVFKRNSSVE